MMVPWAGLEPIQLDQLGPVLGSSTLSCSSTQNNTLQVLLLMEIGRNFIIDHRFRMNN